MLSLQRECYYCATGARSPEERDRDAERWRSALLETVEPYRELPLLLSGGMDSATLLAAMLECGGRPTCYAYWLIDQPESEDLAAARMMCKAWQLPLRVIPLPTSLEEVVRDAKHVINLTRNARVTAVQCCHALHYLLREARRDGHRQIITGAGGIVEDNRKAKILGATMQDTRLHPAERAAAEQELEGVRRPNLLGGNAESATETMKRFGSIVGVTLREPYSEQPVADVGLSIPWPEMNWPRQKGIALRAFRTFFGDPERPRWWRPNSSLQVNGGLRDLHDQMLMDSQINRRGAQRVVALYNEWLKEAESDQTGLF